MFFIYNLVFNYLVTKLKESNMKQKLLQSLPNGVFDKLTRLTVLGLETNQLKSVPVPSIVKGCTSSFVLMNI